MSAGGDPALEPICGVCLGGLKEEHRRCIVMAYHYGLSYEELGGFRAVPVGTVKSWIHRAIGQLQTCLNHVEPEDILSAEFALGLLRGETRSGVCRAA